VKSLNAASFFAASAMLAAAAFLLSPFRPVQAQQPGVVPIFRSRKIPLGLFGKDLASASLRASAASPTFRLTTTEFFGYDFDQNGEWSPLDTTSSYGVVSLNGTQVGTWQFAGTVASADGIVTGLLQLNLTNGTLTIDLGRPSTAGIRSRVNCRPILGGTGAYAKTTGNAGVAQDDVAFFVQLGVR
jgi:hypothetical protein